MQTSYQWPHSSSTHPNCTPELLAAAGFYYAPTEGYLDLCKCHYCGLRLRDWETTDIPWEEHKKHKPTCSFVIKHFETADEEDDLGFNLFGDEPPTSSTSSTTQNAAKASSPNSNNNTTDELVTQEMHLRGQFVSDVLFSLINPQNDWNFDFELVSPSTDSSNIAIKLEHHA
ncbi:hypothetical protein FDP41_003573 [Naegleria fowleri]|uniref:Uncharacterized protein n=1 Tax=Naegleria fowleri TaxID=5763 RepID=A0A6A5BT95_NAEFO|nr:uncharacterized protein FDP41_003573 [Naegleria fowleri]KAF0977581.1 hypothetical protein FDP41_003573 [Naegleria fowleri]